MKTTLLQLYSIVTDDDGIDVSFFCVKRNDITVQYLLPLILLNCVGRCACLIEFTHLAPVPVSSFYNPCIPLVCLALLVSLIVTACRLTHTAIILHCGCCHLYHSDFPRRYIDSAFQEFKHKEYDKLSVPVYFRLQSRVVFQIIWHA